MTSSSLHVGCSKLVIGETTKHNVRKIDKKIIELDYLSSDTHIYIFIPRNLALFLEGNLYIHVIYGTGWIFTRFQFFTATCDTKKEMVN